MNPTQKTGKFPSRSLAGPVLCAALLALSNGAFAQTAAPAPAPTPATSDEVVKMSPFTVTTERDYGYRAANAISATRTNTAIKDVPISIEVFGQELAQDLLANSQVDMEKYDSSLINGGNDAFSSNAIQQNFNNFLFRGFTQNWGLRDGVREYDPVDTQGLSRIEIVKGPVGTLYGVTYPGGVLNLVNKTVDYSHNFDDFEFAADNNGSLGARVDTNITGQLNGGKAGLRLNIDEQKTKDVRAHSEGSIKFYQMVANYQPLPGTEFNFLVENSYAGKPNGLNSFAFQRSDGTQSGASIPLQILRPQIPWDWNYSNGENLRSLAVKYYRGTVTQQVGDNLSLTAYYQFNSHDQIDGNGWDQAGSSGADSWEVAGRGWYTDATGDHIESGYSYRDWTNSVHAYGATGVYKLDFSGIKNTFTFGGAAWAENFISHQQSSAATFIQDFAPGSSVTTPYYKPGDLHEVVTGNGGNHQNNTNDYYFATLNSSFLDDRVKLNLGVNRTHVKNVTWANAIDNAPVSYDISKVSPMEGINFAVTKEYSLFLVHSTSLFPTSNTNSFGVSLPAVTGSSIEGGLKFTTADDKLSGTLSYYNIDQTGGGQTDPTAINNQTVQYDALTALGDPASIALRNGKWAVRPLGDLVPGAKSTSKGFEANATYQPTHNWAFKFSYAYNTNEIVTAINAASIGQANPGTIKQQWSLLTKYTVTSGALNGLSVGGGFASNGKALQGYTQDFVTKALVARYNPSSVNLDLFARYSFKAFNRKQYFQFNIKNATEQGTFTGWQPTGSDSLATQRYTVPVPRVFELAYGIDL